MDGPMDYEKVIADLETRRQSFNAHVDAAIAAIKLVLVGGYGPSSSATPSGPRFEFGGSLTADMLFGKSIPEAAITCLQVNRKPMGSKEIADALDAAHYANQSKNFGNTVNSILNRRAEVVGDVVKVGKSWALAEWYPASRRRRPEPEDKSHHDESTDGKPGE